ncbi:hypothetical protein EOA60_27505, partial [Mesorhizobium sp. M1A.F.Ca.IN.020.06.1.1]|uniref:hypothetical protein n=1 Tax=Mesorhizobium sp. M1A.F.Ca.IN.020.06.1.1 TaxID=2496765 RepID=UPI000FD33179
MQNAYRPACAAAAGQALLSPKIRGLAMDTLSINAKGISVSLDLAVGHIAALEIEADGGRL